jgi:predicted  nucleic acid-binding Zn-ribbon protein
MQKKTEAAKEFRGCPACGVMSFPPVLTPAPKKDQVKNTAQPKQDPVKDVADKVEDLSIEEFGGCPACGVMSFPSPK